MINTAVIMGRLVADPELRHTPSDLAVTSFTVAVDRAYSRSNANGERERQTDFIDVVAWRSTAEFVCRYFRKGQMIALDGSIQTRTYTDSQGNKRKSTEIVANNVSLRRASAILPAALTRIPALLPTLPHVRNPQPSLLPLIPAVRQAILKKSRWTTICRSDFFPRRDDYTAPSLFLAGAD